MTADETCPECGAPRTAGLTCWEQLGLLIAWEHADPELAAEHFLTVACYNFQHPAQFTDAALAGLRSVFLDYLAGRPIAEIRRQVGQRAAGAVRVLRPENERRPVLRRWTLTIADVYTPPHSAGAAARVKAWAASIKAEWERESAGR